MKLSHVRPMFTILWSMLHAQGFLPSASRPRSLQSSRPLPHRCSSSHRARTSVPVLQTVAESAVVAEELGISVPEEFIKKLKQGLLLADRFSTDIASSYAVPGRVSENVDLLKLFTFFGWKLDVFIDEVDDWERFLPPGTPGMPTLNEMWSFDRRDIMKFGPVMHLVIDGQETFNEFVDTVEAQFGDDDEVMKFIDKCIYMFIKCTGDLSINGDVEKAMETMPLEEYKYFRMWSGGGLPLCSIFWFGKDFPQDGTVEAVAAVVSLINDLYDYTKDRNFDVQLSVWRYFDDIEDAIAYVRDFYHDVYDRCGPELREFIKVTLRYQQDVPANSVRGYDAEWYGKLNAIFSLELLEARDVANAHSSSSR